jgi:RND family efflux transporter MFP subunit
LLRHRSCRALTRALPLAAAVILLAACKPAAPPEAEPIRPVRAITVEKRQGGETVTLTGQVEAQEEASLSFRVGGRMTERLVNVGDQVQEGQLVARLDPEQQRAAVQAARAALTAANALLEKTGNEYDRQATLLRQGWATRARYDQALNAYRNADAQVDSAEAQLAIAIDNLDFTELVADGPGVVTARGAEPGEVVAAGRMIVQLARAGGRDAVFDVPAAVMENAPPGPVIEVSLAANAAVRTEGRVREVAPQADPVTRTFRVRVSLNNVPEAMRLGASVNGTMRLNVGGGIAVPASALTRADRETAVWVVDPRTQTVALRKVEIERHDLSTVTVARGLQPDEIVVTAGVQALRAGQKVRLLGATP